MHGYQGYPLVIQFQKEIVCVYGGEGGVGVGVQLYMGEEDKIYTHFQRIDLDVKLQAYLHSKVYYYFFFISQIELHLQYPCIF